MFVYKTGAAIWFSHLRLLPPPVFPPRNRAAPGAEILPFST